MSEESILPLLAELDVLRQLANLQTRNARRQDLNDPGLQILLRLFYAHEHQLPQVSLADDLQLSISQTQKVSQELEKAKLIARVKGAPRGGVLVKLTDEGVKRVGEILSQKGKLEIAPISAAFASLQPNEVKAVTEQLRNKLMGSPVVLRA